MCAELCNVLISTIVNTIRAYVYCGQRQNRTADPLFFRQVLLYNALMKKIYTFGHEQVERHITEDDIIKNKKNNKKMTRVTAANKE